MFQLSSNKIIFTKSFSRKSIGDLPISQNEKHQYRKFCVNEIVSLSGLLVNLYKVCKLGSPARRL